MSHHELESLARIRMTITGETHGQALAALEGRSADSGLGAPCDHATDVSRPASLYLVTPPEPDAE
ncbi:hypothetical protein [Streptomyces sp. NPDC048650]|uniref:hypothetical protein n=1 Tax=unclassified Streptomyces TaxID=2593676 RepID=UPI0037226D3C